MSGFSLKRFSILLILSLLALPICAAHAFGFTGIESSLLQRPPLALLAIGAPLALALTLLVSRHRRRSGSRLDDASAGNQETLGELQQLRNRYRDLLNNSSDAIFLINPADGRLIGTNRSAEKLFGCGREQISSLTPSDLFSADQSRRFLRLVKRVLRTGYAQEPGLKFRRPDGRQFIGAVAAYLSGSGEDRMIHGILRDVTEERQTEDALHRTSLGLQLINQVAHYSAVSSDRQEMLQTILGEVVKALEGDGGGIMLLRNSGRTCELAAQTNIGDEALALLSGACPEGGLLGRMAAEGNSFCRPDLGAQHGEWPPAILQDGWRSLMAAPLIGTDQTVGALFLFNRSPRGFASHEIDLLETIGKLLGNAVLGVELYGELQWQYRLTQASNRELERSRQRLDAHFGQLQETNRSLERLEKLKSNFLALASHELRTPLTYILSAAEFLLEKQDAQLPEDDRRCVEAIHLGGKRLESTVHDLLEVARLESRSFYLAREPVDLNVLLSQIRDEIAEVLQERQLSLSLVPGPADLPLYGDFNHLKRAFSRLVENAVRFTPTGGSIAISSMRRDPVELERLQPQLERFSSFFFRTKPKGSYLQVSVRDSGIGISPEEQHQIFEKFYSAGEGGIEDSAPARFSGRGFGLGLPLAKGLVEAHRGMIWVETGGAGASGEGSTFHILLPLCEPGKEQPDG